MIITYHGGESVKIQFGDTVLAFNPISKQSKLPPSKFGADIVLVSANHPDFNGVEQVTYGDKKPFVISGPGEYEIKDIFIEGFISETKYGGQKLINTMFKVSLEGMNIGFLGALNDEEIKDKRAEEALSDLDILFVPIGGEGVLNAQRAYKLAVSLESKIIIPIHYEGVGEKESLKVFMKESGDGSEAVEKLTLKKKDLEGKEGDVLIIKAS